MHFHFHCQIKNYQMYCACTSGCVFEVACVCYIAIYTNMAMYEIGEMDIEC